MKNTLVVVSFNFKTLVGFPSIKSCTEFDEKPCTLSVTLINELVF